MVQHFIDLWDFSHAELQVILDYAKELKAEVKAGKWSDIGKNKSLSMIFEKNSTRTRYSFELAMKQIGGETIVTSSRDMQLGRGETLGDTAQVLSRFVDAIMIRSDNHDKIHELAKYSNVPLINGLTDFSHPCQIMADIMTWQEHAGDIKGKKLAWFGDGNNVLTSFIMAAAIWQFELAIATPKSYEANAEVIKWAKDKGAKITETNDINIAIKDADMVVTDCFVSMGDTDAEARIKAMMPYQVNTALMAKAKPNALFMHCLPAHRNEEVTDEVIDSQQSIVFDEAENRLHAQKAILCYCLKLGRFNDRN
ncbi:MAG: ornithine carbamoyltransferase [Alphaproteobacteria bacterium]